MVLQKTHDTYGSRIFVNGVEATSANYGVATATGPTNINVTLANLSLGVLGRHTGYRLCGTISEVLSYPVSLSDLDRKLAEDYLSVKYQLSIPLAGTRSGSGTLGLNISEQISATGGKAPYFYSVLGGGAISSSGLYTSPSSSQGTATITITDSSPTPQSTTVSIPWRDPSLP